MPILKRIPIRRLAGLLSCMLALSVLPLAASAWAEDQPPAVGAVAPDFTLQNLAGENVSLKKLFSEGTVVLLVLRGFPGYQCPICTRQVGEFLAKGDDFKAKRARVVMIYPGPAEELDKHAKEFVGAKEFPEGFTFLTDPGYKFTDAYHLRWDAPKETAYPSTFVIDEKGVVRFAKVSRSHGGRSTAREVLEALSTLREAHGK